MRYCILLRGINISGKNTIAMKELAKVLEDHGYTNVHTYLNSGNVVVDSEKDKEQICNEVHILVERHFGLTIPICVISDEKLEDVLQHAPSWWNQDSKEYYDNLIFLIPPTTTKDVCEALGEPTGGKERIECFKNVIFWTYELAVYRKCNWWKKTASESIRDSITIRTANTMYKVLDICKK